MGLFDEDVGTGVRLAVIVGIIALIVVIFMREDGDRSRSDLTLHDPGRRPQTVSPNTNPFHPVIPTPTPRPGTRPY